MIIDVPREGAWQGLKRLWKEAFGDTEGFLECFEKTAFCRERCRCAVEGEEAVAALYWFDCLHGDQRIAYVYGVATAEPYRGKGLCHRLMEDTHRHLAAQGYAGAILVPGSRALFELYGGMGYKICSRIREFSCNASEGGESLRRVDADRYASLRRGMLPEGGVVQEGENLQFLQTQAEFYEGFGFLLAASREGDRVFGAELLGDASRAPGILRALHCERGFFRMPGNGRPFAMYLPFREDAAKAPSYFGLAFD